MSFRFFFFNFSKKTFFLIFLLHKLGPCRRGSPVRGSPVRSPWRARTVAVEALSASFIARSAETSLT